MADVLAEAASGAAKGAAVGSIIPGVGTVIGGGVGAALAVAPEIGRWLFGNAAGDTAQKVADVVTQVTGTPDPEAQTAAIVCNPEMAADLRVEVLRLASQMEAARDASMLAMMQAANADRAGARTQLAQLVSAHSLMAWGAPIVSVLVLIAFAVMQVLAFTSHAAPNNPELVRDLTLTLRDLVVMVVSYWVGSSAGSASKDARLAVSEHEARTSIAPEVAQTLVSAATKG